MSAEIKCLGQYRKEHSLKSQALGVLFEQMFLKMCKRNKVAITRFPDGCRQVGNNKLIRVKTPFDWVITHEGKTALIDTKTSEETTFRHSKIVFHQVNEMVSHQLTGALAGYVIWFRKPDQVMFVDSLELMNRSHFAGSLNVSCEKLKLLGTSSYFDLRLIFPRDISGSV